MVTEVKPNPDPSTLTTDQLLREITLLKEIFNERQSAADKLVNLLRDEVGSRQEDIDAAIGHLRALQDEKFRSIETRFIERDARNDQRAKDNQRCDDNALQASKEAVSERNRSDALATDKMEKAFDKRIDQINDMLNTVTGAIHGKIEDIKLRLAQTEGGAKGLRDVWGYIVGGVGMMIAFASVLTLILKR